MKNPRWITHIEAVAEGYFGYWEQRGWTEPAWVKTTSVGDAAEPAGPGLLAVGGTAYAGARGLKRVEVQLDDGEWQPAELKPPPSGLTWLLWRATLAADPGAHQVAVRAVDSTGAVQTDQTAPPYPDGASGYHSLTATASGSERAHRHSAPAGPCPPHVESTPSP